MSEIRVNLAPMFKQLQPNVLAELKATLQASQSQLSQQLQSDYSQLMNIITQIQLISGGDSTGASFLTQKSHMAAYQRMITTSNSLSANVANQRQTLANDAQLNKLVQDLFVLEHQIMEHLAPSSATTEYTIFYTDPEHGKLPVLEKTITAKDLYGEELISMTKGGKLSNARLTLNTVLRNSAVAKQTTTEDQANVQSLVYEAIANMVAWLETLEEAAHIMHLGKKRWRRLLELRLLLGTSEMDDGTSAFWNNVLSKSFSGTIDPERLNRLLDYYINNEELGIDIHSRTLGKNGRVYTRKSTYRVSASQNRGHIYEALVRMRRDKNLTAQSALEQSIGRDIWWAQGDVNSTQVKTLLGGNQQVSIATLNSIFDFANYLLQLLSQANTALAQLDQHLAKKVETDSAEIDVDSANDLASMYVTHRAQVVINQLAR